MTVLLLTSEFEGGTTVSSVEYAELEMLILEARLNCRRRSPTFSTVDTDLILLEEDMLACGAT